MRTTELALVAAVMLGCVLKLMHWPGASFLIVCGGCLLALFYFPFGFRTLPAPKPTDQLLWLTVVGGASLGMGLSGLVAFLQSWPHSSMILLIGAIGCACSLLSGAMLRFTRPRLDIYLDSLLIRCFVLGGLAITLWTLFNGKPR